ncbi:class I SAM-dependent methyltransferase [Luteimonas saliphila]|uniref:class I SAM-dependent methyltransferase n=1 Tax=Luteimonas saliphila TaxID=2804919 RepID=UPI00192DFB3E|nr:class I SAM-dependent methyltransferase [Luteimonas saliphila]
MQSTTGSSDSSTAQAFSTSWNNLPGGSVYTAAQFAEWLAPLSPEDFRGREVLELGCGNGSLMVHAADWEPARLVGVELGDSVRSARENMRSSPVAWEIVQDDLVAFESGGFDIAYCIGVLHHLKRPRAGFDSVVRNTRPGGRFHCWVYAREGNAVVRLVVEPVRRVACHLPWWVTKYVLATPMVAPYFLYAKLLSLVTAAGTNRLARGLGWLPLFDYSMWIARRDFAFFRHVAFDQLVTPQTAYISRTEVDDWLRSNPAIAADSTYVILRNGNSWKFGGRIQGG